MSAPLPSPLPTARDDLPRTDVYYNLHSRVWSMLDRRTGRVYEHAPVVVSPLHVGFVVRAAGHARALREGQKNVHAFVRGDYLEPFDDVAGWQAHAADLPFVPVSYNPFRAPSFYRKDTGQDVAEAKAIVMIAPGNGPPWVGAMF